MVAHPRRAFSGDRWFALLLMSRLLGATLAVALLVAHRVTEHDLPLVAVTIAWTVVTLAGFGRAPALRAAPAAWVADTVAALALVLLSGDWRSPFYLFALTTLVLPATTLRWRAALAWSATFSGAYAGVALLMHKLPLDTIANTIRLETLATHLVLPTLVTGALAYASMLLSDLRAERVRSERMAVQAERQRIAWELHDSAKQRVHAAHLLLSALDTGRLNGHAPILEQALAELRAAGADMETSIAELRAPADGRPVDALLRERADALTLAGRAQVAVHGRLPPLPPLVAAHTYRIAAEALTNAVRHARGSRVELLLASGPGGGRVVVQDDGVGLQRAAQRSGQGLRSMRGRAETIGARLHIGSGPDGSGTRVTLDLPDHPDPETVA